VTEFANDDPRLLAGRLAGCAELHDVRLVRLSSELSDGSLDPPFSVKVEVEPACQVEGFEDGVWQAFYTFSYRVDLSTDDGPVAHVECKLQSAYGFRTPDAPQEIELVAFGETTVVLGLHPYLRELIHGITARFGIGPVVLPVYRQPIRRPANAPKLIGTADGPARERAPVKKKAVSKATAKKESATKSVPKRKSRTD
jgi:hypothetical protein